MTNVRERTPTKIEPEAEHLVKLFFEANRVSQGGGDLLHHVFRYIRVIHPEWQISDGVIDKVLLESRKVLRKYFIGGNRNLRHKTVPLPTVYVEARQTLESFRKLFSPDYSSDKEPMPSIDEAIQNIAHGTFSRDLEYLNRSEGRPSSAGDKFRSFLNYYALEGHKTSCPEINKMWELVGDFVLEQRRAGVWRIGPLKGDVEEDFPELIRLWQKKHPGKDFFAGRLNA